VWYLIIFVLSMIILIVSIFIVWKWTRGERKNNRV